MTDVFISYSRKDKVFVRRLHDGLIEAGFDVWLDVEDIPPAVDFEVEIFPAIEAADKFAFIISPDSVASKYCGAELSHAIELKKPLIPIVCRAVAASELDKNLSPINWIDFETLEYETALQKVIEAIRTDQKIATNHRRFLVRALQWDQKKQNPSFLLRGDDLKEAEAWVLESASKQPEPTELHSKYIAASRKATNRRQRNLLAGVSVALVVSAILGLLALYQSGVAGNNAATAVANAVTATIAQGQSQNNAATSAANASTAIAAQATSDRRAEEAQSLALAASVRGLRRDRNFDLALALAVEANQIPNPPLDTQRVLAELAYLPLARNVLTGLDYTGQRTGVRALAFSPDKKYLVASFDDSGIRTWDLETGIEKTQYGMGGNAIAFHPNEGVYATGGNYNQDYPIDLYDLAKELSFVQLKGHDNYVRSMSFSPDGKSIVAGTTDGFLTVWDVETRKITNHFQVSTNSVNAFSFSPDGRFIALGSDDYAIHVWDWITSEESFQSANVGQVNSLMYDSGGNYLFSAMDDGNILMLDVRSGRVERSFAGHTASVTSIDLSADGRYFLSGSFDTTVRLWDIPAGSEILRSEGHTTTVTTVKFTPDGQYGVSGSSDGTIRFWDLFPGGQIAQFSAADIPSGHTIPVLSVDFSPDERYVVFGSENGVVERWDLTTQTRIQSIKVQDNGPVDSVVYSPSGDQLLTVSHESTTDDPTSLKIWDIKTGTPLESVKIQASDITNARFGVDGHSIIYQTYDANADEDNFNATHIYDISSGSEIYRFNAEDMILSFDGNSALSSVIGMLGGIPYSDLTVWNFQTYEKSTEFHIPGISVFNPKYSPVSDQIIAFPSAHSSISLWDLSTNKEIRRFEGDALDAHNIAFSPSGQYLAAIDSDSIIHLWDVATGLELRRFELIAFGSGVSSNMVFSPSGRYLLTGYSDNTVRLWRIDSLDDLIDWTYANRYVPALTCEERFTYRVEPYCDANGIQLTHTPQLTDTSLTRSATPIS